MRVIAIIFTLCIALTSVSVIIGYRPAVRNYKLTDFNHSNFKYPPNRLNYLQAEHRNHESQPTLLAIHHRSTQNDRAKKTLLSICMSVTYASIIISVMTYPPCMSLLKNQYPVTSTLFNYKTLFAVGTIITMVGKFTLGAPTDEFGGEFTMKLTMLIMAICLSLFSITTSFAQFAPIWILISYVYASAWGYVNRSLVYSTLHID